MRLNVHLADGPAWKAFLEEVQDITDYCAKYDEAEGNYGDVERIGDRLQDALIDLKVALKASRTATPSTERGESADG